MSENQDGQERSEEPTAKRRQESKNKGQVPRSRELNTSSIVVIGALALLMFGSQMVGEMMRMMERGLTAAATQGLDHLTTVSVLGDMVKMALWLVAPFMALMMAAALITPVALGGFVFSAESLKPKFNKISPASGLKKIVSVNGLMELLKSVAKVLLIGVAFVFLMLMYQHDFVSLAEFDAKESIAKAGWLLGVGFFYLSLTTIVVAVIDAPFQIWQNKRQMKMTKQEVRDEMKDQEGKPEVKSKIRQLQQEAAFARMMDAVPDADVIITNPTHFAVALKFDPKTMSAPVLLAKGTDLIAERIRELGRENNIPLVSAPPLARAIFASTDLSAEIPAALYVAVAEVLAFVFQLNRARSYGRRPPKAPNPEVPEDVLKHYGVDKEPR